MGLQHPYTVSLWRLWSFSSVTFHTQVIFKAINGHRGGGGNLSAYYQRFLSCPSKLRCNQSSSAAQSMRSLQTRIDKAHLHLHAARCLHARSLPLSILPLIIFLSLCSPRKHIQTDCKRDRSNPNLGFYFDFLQPKYYTSFSEIISSVGFYNVTSMIISPPTPHLLV